MAVAAAHWSVFGWRPWVSHIGDHAIFERCAPDAVDLHIETLGFQYTDGDCRGLGRGDTRCGEDQSAGRRGQRDKCEQCGTHGGPAYIPFSGFHTSQEEEVT